MKTRRINRGGIPLPIVSQWATGQAARSLSCKPYPTANPAASAATLGQSEATQLLPEEKRIACPTILWSELGGFRNILVHNYPGDIDPMVPNVQCCCRASSEHLAKTGIPVIAGIQCSGAVARSIIISVTSRYTTRFSTLAPDRINFLNKNDLY